jgi:hypothetical protein
VDHFPIHVEAYIGDAADSLLAREFAGVIDIDFAEADDMRICLDGLA